VFKTGVCEANLIIDEIVDTPLRLTVPQVSTRTSSRWVPGLGKQNRDV